MIFPNATNTKIHAVESDKTYCVCYCKYIYKNIRFTNGFKNVCLILEGVNDAGDSTGQNGTLVEVKEEEAEEQPVAKKKRGGKSQAKSQKMPKEEVKSEGNETFWLLHRS